MHPALIILAVFLLPFVAAIGFAQYENWLEDSRRRGGKSKSAGKTWRL